MKFATISVYVIKQLCETITMLFFNGVQLSVITKEAGSFSIRAAGDLYKEGLLYRALFGLQRSRDVMRY